MAQQHRWNTNFTAALTFLCNHNTGVCLKISLSFGELIDYYIIGIDETCLMTDDYGDLKNCGEIGRKNHEKKVADFRYYTTMVRSGSLFGSNGPKEFIMKGKKRRNGYYEKFLEKNGAAPDSTIFMTDNEFMTEKEWAEIDEKVGMCICCYIFPFL